MKFWITLVRGMLAVALGIALVLQVEKARPILANFMGMYWLMSGLISIRFSVTGERARGLSLLAGIIGVLAGLGMVGRDLAAGYVPEEVLISSVGLIIMLTGILHISGGFRQDRSSAEKRTFTGIILGLFEIILGLMLVISPLDRGPIVYFAAMVWALVGGFILLGDALNFRRRQQVDAATE